MSARIQSAMAEAIVQRRIAAGASCTRCLSGSTTASSRTKSSPPQPPGPWMSGTDGAIAISSVKASRQGEGCGAERARLVGRAAAGARGVGGGGGAAGGGALGGWGGGGGGRRFLGGRRGSCG